MPESPSTRRTDFLLEYYKVLWDNINRHIQGVWQTLATLGVSVALLSLVGDGHLPLGLAVALIVGVCAWFAASTYDSALWFARNQVIATNIERLFLTGPEDARLIQPYYKSHRPQPLISHFRIALWLSRGLAVTTLAYHTAVDVYPSFSPTASVDLVKVFPYLALLVYLVVEWRSRADVLTAYRRQLEAGQPATAENTDGPGAPAP